jgi:hypothetical protein
MRKFLVALVAICTTVGAAFTVSAFAHGHKHKHKHKHKPRQAHRHGHKHPGRTTPPKGGAPTSPSTSAPSSSTLDRPYSDKSPFNTPIPDNVQVLPNSAAIVDNSGLGTTPSPMRIPASPSVDYSHPIYHAKSGDPSYTIQCRSGGVNGRVIQIPNGARPTGSSDGHMAVVQTDGWEYDFWQATAPSGGTVRCNIAYRQRYDGLGIVTTDMKRRDSSLGGGTAAYFGEAAGLIRASEIQAGVIPHALFLVIRSGSSGTVYPAYKPSVTSNSNGPMMGQRYRLNMSDSAIEASCAPAWEKTVAKAMAHYGLYFGDTGGDGFGLMMESPLTYTAVGQPNPWDSIAGQYGIRRDATYGYMFRWSNCINYRAAMQAIAPPAQ